MLDSLKYLKNHSFDVLTFLEGEEDSQIKVELNSYTTPGEKVGGNQVGELYDIILFQDHEEDVEKFDKLDHFVAILGDPLEYISQLIPSGWYGIIARKTTTSEEIVAGWLDNIKSAC